VPVSKRLDTRYRFAFPRRRDDPLRVHLYIKKVAFQFEDDHYSLALHTGTSPSQADQWASYDLDKISDTKSDGLALMLLFQSLSSSCAPGIDFGDRGLSGRLDTIQAGRNTGDEELGFCSTRNTLFGHLPHAPFYPEGGTIVQRVRLRRGSRLGASSTVAGHSTERKPSF
jgi:hypothetical protein